MIVTYIKKEMIQNLCLNGKIYGFNKLGYVLCFICKHPRVIHCHSLRQVTIKVKDMNIWASTLTTLVTRQGPEEPLSALTVHTLTSSVTHLLSIFWPQREKTCLRGFVNNTGADQPAHPRSLISAFVIRFLESIICKLAAGESSIFQLVSVVEETGLKSLCRTP